MLASEFGTGQLFWSVLWFSLFALWFWLVLMLFTSIMRSDTLSGWGKALWTLGIIFMPFLGIFLYLIVNGDDIGRRARTEPSGDAGAFAAPAGEAISDKLVRLTSQHESGSITDTEFADAKRQLLSQ
jgi:hypothetical protein